MLLRNSSGSDQTRKRALTFLVLGMLILLGLIVILIRLFDSSGQAKLGESGEYVDPGSGETISSPEGKTPENYGGNAADPIYLGFSKLLDKGITMGQLTDIKLALSNYSQETEKKVQEFSIDIATIKQEISGDQFILTFKLTADRKEIYDAKITRTDLADVQVYLSDSAGTQVFDSTKTKRTDVHIEE